jgi:hypothetical protein
MNWPEAEGNFEHPHWHHCPTPDGGSYQIGDRWTCMCGQPWRVYELGTKYVLWERTLFGLSRHRCKIVAATIIALALAAVIGIVCLHALMAATISGY